MEIFVLVFIVLFLFVVCLKRKFYYKKLIVTSFKKTKNGFNLFNILAGLTSSLFFTHQHGLRIAPMQLTNKLCQVHVSCP